ncbi:hypothetical protein CIB48_g4527 [Xylaria polymorpha]|nr:hypothetical protein CIB48_g4527 [Xylaria polymorpha]
MGIAHLHHRSARQTARLRQIVVVSVICLAIYCFLLEPEDSLDSSRSANPEVYQQRQREERYETLPPELLNNRFLTEDQCRATFPGLLEQVDDEVAKGPFKLERLPSNLGPLIARIRDGQLYILSAARKSDLSREMLSHRAATLHQIANALLTWPRPSSSSSSSSSSPPSSSPHSHIPNTIFAFNHHDDPQASTFSYSRPADPELLATEAGGEKRFFPIPHFSFYAWALPFIGSLPRAAQAISGIESSVPFASKIPRACGGGTTWFNNARAGRVRQNLVRAFGTAESSPGTNTGAKRWADVEALEWGSGAVDAGGSSSTTCAAAWSSRRPSRGSSTSRICCAPCSATRWIQRQRIPLPLPLSHPHPPPHLVSLSALYSPLPARRRRRKKREKPKPHPPPQGVVVVSPRHPISLGEAEKPPPLLPYPAPWVRSAWPTSYAAASEANIVFVAPDWSDLEATVAWLEAHPGIASGIARRQRALFHGGGYLSPAAEACYWRGLIRGWSEVVRVDDGAFDDLEEVTWEEFSLKEIHK